MKWVVATIFVAIVVACTSGGPDAGTGDGGAASSTSSTSGGSSTSSGSTSSTGGGSSSGGSSSGGSSGAPVDSGNPSIQVLDDGAVCTKDHYACTMDEQCCTGVCNTVTQKCGCNETVGSICGEGPDCCPGMGCSLDTKLCCRGGGAPCNLNTDCCNGYCPNKFCAQ